jgi:hypothetical protein
MPVSAVQATDAMTHGHSIIAACAADRALVDREYNRVTLLQIHDVWSGLQAWTLLGQDELSTGKILSGLRQKNRHLQWENQFSVQILMQAVVVLRAVLQQQGCGPQLAGT